MSLTCLRPRAYPGARHGTQENRSFDTPGLSQVPSLGLGGGNQGQTTHVSVKREWFPKGQGILRGQKHGTVFFIYCHFSTTQSWMKRILAGTARVSVYLVDTC